MTKIEDLLAHFELDEQTYAGIARDPGVVAAAEAFMGMLLPLLDPYLRQGIALGAAGAAGASGPAGPVVGIATSVLGNAGLSAIERWLAAKAAAQGSGPA